MDNLAKQFKQHEDNDAQRFKAIEDKLDLLPTREDMQPIIDAWVTVQRGRNGLLWIAVTLTAIGSVVLVVKNIFK